LRRRRIEGGETTGAELIAEGEQLAKPSVLLKASGSDDQFAGVWGGRGFVPAPTGQVRHWLTIDCRFLPVGLGPSTGCLSIYTNEEKSDSGLAQHSARAELRRSKECQPLYAFPDRSLPPIDAVFRFGSKAIQ
jgi:hypothetical protein